MSAFADHDMERMEIMESGRDERKVFFSTSHSGRIIVSFTSIHSGHINRLPPLQKPIPLDPELDPQELELPQEDDHPHELQELLVSSSPGQ